MADGVKDDAVSIATTKNAKSAITPETETEKAVMQKDVGPSSPKDDGANEIEEHLDSDSADEEVDWISYFLHELNDEEKELNIRSMIEKMKMSMPPENEVFQLCKVVVQIDHEAKQGGLYGHIKMYDDEGELTFFERDEDDTIPICHNDPVPLGGSFDRCLSAKGTVHLLVFLCLDFSEDEYLVVADDSISWNVSGAGLGEYCRCVKADGEDGYANVYYISLTCAVQATVEASLHLNGGGTLDDVYGTIVAYYDEFLYDCKDEDRHHYHVVLFEKSKGKAAQLKPGKIQLLTNVVAVPGDASLVIKAQLYTSRDEKQILDGLVTFPAKYKNRSNLCMAGEGCSLDWQVTWRGPSVES